MVIKIVLQRRVMSVGLDHDICAVYFELFRSWFENKGIYEFYEKCKQNFLRLENFKNISTVKICQLKIWKIPTLNFNFFQEKFSLPMQRDLLSARG